MGATYHSVKEPLSKIVSIHAPVMGATSVHLFKHVAYSVSIHAPVMGATNKLEAIKAI